MLEQLDKTTPNNQAHSAVCEDCCYRMATGDNPLLHELSELLHFLSAFVFVAIEETIKFLRRLFVSLQPKKLDHEHVQGLICARCVTARQRAPFRWLETIADHVDTVVQVIAFIAMLIGGFCAGMAVLVMSIFPAPSGTAKPQAERKEDHHLGDHADDAKKDLDDKNADDDRDSPQSLKREAEPSFWKTYSKHTDEINEMGKKPFWDTHNDVSKDDHLIKELNATMRAVEDGREDPRKLKALQDDVYKSRQEKNQKDAKRDMLHGKFLDAQAKARKCFDLAAIAQNNRDFDKRDGLVAEGESAWGEAKAIMGDFRSI